MDNNNKQKQSLEEKFLRAGSFEEMTRTKGWEYVSTYIQNQIRAFTNKSLLSDGFKTMEEYQYARGFVNGLRELLGEIEGDMRYAREHKNTKSTK